MEKFRTLRVLLEAELPIRRTMLNRDQTLHKLVQVGLKGITRPCQTLRARLPRLQPQDLGPQRLNNGGSHTIVNLVLLDFNLDLDPCLPQDNPLRAAVSP